MNGEKPRVFISCTDIQSEALQLLQEKCHVVVCAKLNPTKEEVHEMVKGVDGIFWFWFPSTGVDKDLLDAAGPQLKVIAINSSGYEHLDRKEITRRGIKIGYAPNIQNESVADMALTLLLAVTHRLQEGVSLMNQGNWYTWQQNFLGTDIYQSTVGIVGLGGIGQAIARRIKAFEVSRLLYCGPTKKKEGEEFGAEYVSFEELLKLSNIVIIACRLTASTRGMFNEAVFEKMKSNSILINIARGAIVDHDALLKALEKGKLWGAGLDVMVPEPLPPDSPFLRLKNCVITPHIGSATIQTRRDMAVLTAENILAALEDKPMPSPLL